MNRQKLKRIYSKLTLDEKQEMARVMGYKLSTLRRYCMYPASEKIGKERWLKFLTFRSKEWWSNKASEIDNVNNEDINIDLPLELVINGLIYRRVDEKINK